MTPFGRQPVTAGLLATEALAEAPAPQVAPDKWALLRELTTARAAFAVSDRDLAVLSALLSFHPVKELLDDDRLIVFPSNTALSERSHGMAESTLRRHLAALVRAGLIIRRDSPNGKRYATRGQGGQLDRVFGFDLRPLLVRSPEIAAKAQQMRAALLALRRRREMIVIQLRDASKLIAWGQEHTAAEWQDLADRALRLQRQLRRRLDDDLIAELQAEAASLLDVVKGLITNYPEEMNGNDAHFERHYQNSNPNILESDLCSEEQKAAPRETGTAMPAVNAVIPLSLVLKAASDIRDYAPHGIRTWAELVSVAEFVRPMLGISPDAWRDACQNMGAVNAAITLVCILQRSAEIMRPGGYLRALTEKAATTGFSPGPMVMALLRVENTRAV